MHYTKYFGALLLELVPESPLKARHTVSAGSNAPGVDLKIRSLDPPLFSRPVFKRGPPFNRENTVGSFRQNEQMGVTELRYTDLHWT